MYVLMMWGKFELNAACLTKDKEEIIFDETINFIAKPWSCDINNAQLQSFSTWLSVIELV